VSVWDDWLRIWALFERIDDGPGLEKLGHADFSSFAQTFLGAETPGIAAFFIVRVCGVIFGNGCQGRLCIGFWR